MINREYLYYMASIIWMIPGLILTTKGLFLPFVTNHFIATFYTGLGSMLLLSSIRFVLYPIKNQDK